MILTEVRNYLDEVRAHLHLPINTERQVISELYTHFQERVAELQQEGIPEQEATKTAIESFGRAREVARLIYEAHSKGSWTNAVMACLPHLIGAGLFASHLWHRPLLALIAFTLVVCVTLLGWWHGKPNWLYSWIGYALLPLLIIGYASWFPIQQALSFLLWREGFLPSSWLLALVITFYVLSLWFIVSTTIRVVRRDWLLATLMLVPLPIVGCWLFNIEQAGSSFQGAGAGLHQWDMPMALTLVVLGVTTATFIRLRQRVLKVGALITVSSVALVMVAHTLWGNLGFLGLLALSLSMLIFLFTPALLEAIIGHGEQRKDTWWRDDWIEHPSAVK